MTKNAAAGPQCDAPKSIRLSKSAAAQRLSVDPDNSLRVLALMTEGASEISVSREAFFKVCSEKIREASRRNDQEGRVNYFILRDTAKSINESIKTARLYWVTHLLISLYMLVTLLKISHDDLLLLSKLSLPIIDSNMEAPSFFIAAPAIYTLMHGSLLFHHAMLARAIERFDEDVAKKMSGHAMSLSHLPHRIVIYFLAQMKTTSRMNGFLAFSHRVLSYVTLYVVPIIILMMFQVTYLPAHSFWINGWIRVWIIVCLIQCFTFGLLMRTGNASLASSFFDYRSSKPWSCAANLTVVVLVFLTSMFIGTVPDGDLDRWTSENLPCVSAPYDNPRELIPRCVFVPTAFLLERGIDAKTGTSKNRASRNLILLDRDLSASRLGDPARNGRMGLRNRDLTYGAFDGSSFSGADLSGSRFVGASVQNVDFSSSNLAQTNFCYADLRGSNFTNATVTRSNIAYANLDQNTKETLLAKGAVENKGKCEVSIGIIPPK